MIFHHVDFEAKGQLKNALLHLQTGILGATAKGQIFYDGLGATPSLHAYVHDGVAARKLLQDNDLSANADWTLDTDKLATRATTKLYIDSLVSGVSNFRGVFDASSGAVPTATNIKAGDYWRVTVAGTVTGISPNPKLQVGDVVYASVANATAGTDFFALQANFATATDIALDTTNAWGGAATDVQAALKELWTKTGGSGGLQYLPLAGTGASAASKMTGPINWADDQNIYLGSNYVSNSGTALLSSRNAGATINMRLAVNQFPPNVQSSDLSSAWRGFAMDMSSDGSATIWANNSAGASTTSNTKGLMYGYDHTAYWNTLTATEQENIIPSMKMVKSLISGVTSGAFLPLAGGTMTGTINVPLNSVTGYSAMQAKTYDITTALRTTIAMNFDKIGPQAYGAWSTSITDKDNTRLAQITLLGSASLYTAELSSYGSSGSSSILTVGPGDIKLAFGGTLANSSLYYAADYSAVWNARSAAIRDRIIPDIAYIKNLIATSGAARQTVTLTGDGVATNFNITHAKGTEPLVQIYDAITNKMIVPEEVTTVNATTLNITFSYAIAAGKVYKVSIF